MSEFQIEEAILEYLNIMGYMAWKNHTAGHYDGKKWRRQASRFAINGVSDIIAIKNGRVSFIEVKTSVGKQSPAQRSFQANLEAQNGSYYLVRSVADVRKLIDEKKI
jgi:Holliday junction resolvase-like predicted endonuclease